MRYRRSLLAPWIMFLAVAAVPPTSAAWADQCATSGIGDNEQGKWAMCKASRCPNSNGATKVMDVVINSRDNHFGEPTGYAEAWWRAYSAACGPQSRECSSHGDTTLSGDPLCRGWVQEWPSDPFYLRCSWSVAAPNPPGEDPYEAEVEDSEVEENPSNETSGEVDTADREDMDERMREDGNACIHARSSADAGADSLSISIDASGAYQSGTVCRNSDCLTLVPRCAVDPSGPWFSCSAGGTHIP